MRKHYYRIAGHCIEILFEKDFNLVLLKEFVETGEPYQPEIKIELREDCGAFSSCYGITYYQADTQYPNVFISQKHSFVKLVASHSFDKGVIEGCRSGLQESVMEMLLVVVYSYLARREWLLIHASCIDYQGSGVIFTGRSGIGKTTQAKLWAKYQGAEILNGDKVLLQAEASSGISAWGSPWRGSSPYVVNRSVPLKAVVVLQQDTENQIKQLNGWEKLQYLSTNIFYPFWDKECTEKCMNAMERLGKLPVYLLTCKPDEEAVSLTYHTIL